MSDGHKIGLWGLIKLAVNTAKEMEEMALSLENPIPYFCPTCKWKGTANDLKVGWCYLCQKNHEVLCPKCGDRAYSGGGPKKEKE